MIYWLSQDFLEDAALQVSVNIDSLILKNGSFICQRCGSCRFLIYWCIEAVVVNKSSILFIMNEY